MTDTNNPEPARNVPALRVGGGAVAPIIPADFEGVFRLANAVSVARMAPKSLDTAEKVTVAMLFGLELGLTPMMGMQSIAVVNGVATVWGDGALALIRSHPEFESISETFEGEPYEDNYKAVCTIVRRGQPRVTRSFSVAQAKKARLWTKEGPWQTYPDRMMQMRARSWGMRDTFADALRGIPIAEEVQDVEVIDTPPKGRRREALNLPGGQQGEGFDPAHVARETGQGGQPDAVDAEVSPVHDAATETQAVGEKLDDLQKTQSGGTGLQAEGEDAEKEHADPGETYLIQGEKAGTNGRLQTYRDGKPHSTVTEKGATKLSAYAVHPPVTNSGDGGEPATTTEAQGADAPADPQPAPPAESEAATPASDPSPAPSDTSPPTPSAATTTAPDGGATSASPSEPAIRANPEDRTEPAADAGPQTTDAVVEDVKGADAADATFPEWVDAYLAKIGGMSSWLTIKSAYGTVYRSPEFAAASDALKTDIKVRTWEEAARVKAEHRDPVDQATDVTAFGLWLNVATDPDEVAGCLQTLRATPVFGKLSPEVQERLTAEAKRTEALLRGEDGETV